MFKTIFKLFLNPSETKLRVCNLDECEALCCSSGAFLLKKEATTIRQLVAEFPDHFPNLPKHFIVKGGWEGYTGRKTALRPHHYRNKPAHLDGTRCVFAESDGKCSFQTLAVAQNKHKWIYKPLGCWLFPMSLDSERKIVQPPRNPAEDPDNIGADYPGFTAFVPCGTHRRDGDLWRKVLDEEIKYYEKKYENL